MINYSPPKGESAKVSRQQALRDIIREEVVGTQAALVQLLETRGFVCTQVSISRDIRELGLIKQGGRYVAPSDPTDHAGFDQLAKNVSPFIKDIVAVGDNLIVVRTLPGTAHSAGVLLDRSGWREVAGTVAGDDTVFMAVRGGPKSLAGIVSRLRALINKEKDHGE